MRRRIISYPQLKPEKGIPGSKVTIWRKERDGKFPKRIPIGAFYGWPDHVIDVYVGALIEGHSEEAATTIAERARFAGRDGEAA